MHIVPYDREYLQKELKWLFKKKRDEMGIYFDFKPLRSSSVMVSLLSLGYTKVLQHCVHNKMYMELH